MRKVLAVLCCLVLAAGLLTGCGEKAPNGLKKKKVDREPYQSELAQFAMPQAGDPIAVFHTGEGEIRAVLYPDQAPMAVENFIGLAEEGFYNDMPFHRVLYGFVVQGGDADGTGHSGRTIWNNNPYPKEMSGALRHYPGALCAAFSPEEPISGGSQFYFVQALPGAVDESLIQQLTENGTEQAVIDAYSAVGGLPYLDYTDTVFGQVYEGMDVVDEIARRDTDENGLPDDAILIEEVTIEAYEPEE